LREQEMPMSALRLCAQPLTLSLLFVLACGEDKASPRALDDDEDPSTGETGDDEGRPGAMLDGSMGSNKPRPDTGVVADAGRPSVADEPEPTLDAGGEKGDEPKGGGCLDGITDYGAAGPFKFAAKAAGAVKFTVPEVPAGCKVPVVHLANGTGATCAAYKGVLDRLASHGFLAACYEDPQTGAGSQGLMALELAFEMFPDLVDNKIGSTGHSQGGQAAFTVLQLAEDKWGDEMTYAGLAMQPASGFGSQPTGGTWQSVYAKIKSPMFMFSGTADTLVSAAWVQRGFDAMAKTNETYNWSAIGATHVPVPTGPTQEVSIPWFRWKLLGDNAACLAFKALPATGQWDEVKSQNAVDCK
jgi:hypothetical protein